MGAVCTHFCLWVRTAPIFIGGIHMHHRSRFLSHAALLAAMYFILTHLQNLIFPDSANLAIQFRASEALCIFALFTPAAIPGLTIGCFLFNLSFAAALPLDCLVGSLATFLATGGMYLTRRWSLKGYPLPALLLPALFNAFLVGWELSVYIGGGFWINAVCVAIGEIAVLLSLGTILFYAIKLRHLDVRLFEKR